MIGEVQWNVQRGQKLHLDWCGPTRSTGCMDDATLDQVRERFAAIAMLMEDMSASLLEAITSREEMVFRYGELELALSELQNQTEIVRNILVLND